MIKFGTDGWRGKIADDFTFENVRIVSGAIADYFNGKLKRKPKMAVGYDARYLSDKFAATVSEVLAENGIDVILSPEMTPTPVLSSAIELNKLDGGIMVTASHNPYDYNGIKIKMDFAGSAEPEVTNKVEKLVKKQKKKSLPRKKGKITLKDMRKPYLKYVRSYMDWSLLKKKNYNILAEVMYGAGGDYFEDIMKPTKCRIETLHNEINPSFGGVNPEPIAKNLQEFGCRMKGKKYDIGLAVDGDGDRSGAAIPGGQILTAHQILSLIALHFIEDLGRKGAIVKTVSGTYLLNRIAKHHKCKLIETPVGFKYIAKLMRTKNVLIGGEESGGFGFGGYIPERDGFLSGLLLVQMMAYRKKSINQIIKDMEKVYGPSRFYRADVKFPAKDREKIIKCVKSNYPKDLLGSKVIEVKDYDGFKFEAADCWLLLRFSGTEPIIRIYAESASSAKSKKITELGKKLAGIK